MEERKLKLNFKNTFKIGFAFFGILMLWQVYNTYCPIILEAMLKDRGLTNYHYIVGIIMALDNVAAIIVMPLVGKMSDKTKTKWGKRMPYIVIGMLLTAIVFPFIALMCYFNIFVGVIIFMLLFLIIMQAYRSPAVAFMPDVTPKPLRSTANGIINLVGYLGGVFATIIGMLPFLKLNDSSSLAEIQSKIIWPFIITTIVFVLVLIFLIFRVNENKLVEETKDDVAYGETLADTEEAIKDDNKLSKSDFRNFILILIAIFFWFMAFNSFETFGSLFFKDIVKDSTIYSTMAMVLSVVSILSFVLFSTLSNKIGRKLTIVIGLVLLIVALVTTAILSIVINDFSNTNDVATGYKLLFIVIAAIMGVGWALVNINSFPMVVEFSNKDNIGKFTSYYYMSSMLAQSITPILVGFFMDYLGIGKKILFIYAAIMMIIALVVFIFIKEKISLSKRKEMAKDEKKKSVFERIGDND